MCGNALRSPPFLVTAYKSEYIYKIDIQNPTLVQLIIYKL